MSRRRPSRDGKVEDDPVPMAVSDDEEDGGDADLRKVVVVNPFFAEKHLGPRATHPDGTLDTKAQLTSLWVLGDPTRPKREPRPLDPPGVVLRRPHVDPKTCGCLPSKCGPCHPGGPPPSSDLGSRRGTVSSWGDDSEAYGYGPSLCGPDGLDVTRACVPGAFRSRRRGDDDDDWLSDDDVDPASAKILKEQRETRRPAPEPGAPREPPPPGCLSGCLEEEEWSEDEKGRRRRRRKKTGCLAGCAGKEDPVTGAREPGCVSSLVDFVDGAVDDETGRRRGGVLGACLGNEDPIGSGKRRGGCFGEGCLFGFVDADADGVVRRRGGCLTNCLYGAEDPEDASIPPRRRGGVLGSCLGDPDPETNARRGGVLGACLGDEDPDRPGERGRRDAPGCLLGVVVDDGDGGTPRRRGGLAGACLGDEDPETGARKGGCLAAYVGDEDPETGRRRGGCLSGCLFGDDDDRRGTDDERGKEDDGGDGRRRRGRDENGCLAGCDEDSDWGTGSSEDELDRDPSRRARPERTCLAECLRALCGSSEASRRRRRRRRRRAREARIAAAGEKEAGADFSDDDDARSRDHDLRSDMSEMSELEFRDDADWAATAWEQKPPGYLGVRAVVLRTHKPPPRVIVDFLRPSMTLFSLLGAFFAPALWRVSHRLCSPRVTRIPRTSKARYSPIKEKEEKVVSALAKQTLPFLPDVGRELLSATLGLLFLEKAAALAFTRNKTSAKSFGKRDERSAEDVLKIGVRKTSDKGEEVFWLCGLFPQFARAARGDGARVRARRAAVIRMRWRAERRRRENEETWADVVPPKVSNEDGLSGTKSKPDEKEKEKGEGWTWPSVALPTFALPSLPNLPALADVEVEWRSQTNPDNDSKVAFDPSVERALRAKMRRHRMTNKNQRLYWPGAEMLEIEEGAAKIAKPVDDVYRGDDDTDKTIGLGVSRMRR